MTEHDLKEVQRLYEFYRGARESDGRNGVHRAMDFVEGFVAGEKASEHRREEMQLKVLELEAIHRTTENVRRKWARLYEEEHAKASDLLNALKEIAGRDPDDETSGGLMSDACIARHAIAVYEASCG